MPGCPEASLGCLFLTRWEWVCPCQFTPINALPAATPKTCCKESLTIRSPCVRPVVPRHFPSRLQRQVSSSRGLAGMSRISEQVVMVRIAVWANPLKRPRAPRLRKRTDPLPPPRLLHQLRLLQQLLAHPLRRLLQLLQKKQQTPQQLYRQTAEIFLKPRSDTLNT